MNKSVALILTVSMGLSASAQADLYSSLLKRYEKQIKQQERQLNSLRARLEIKERDVNRWMSKAQAAKSAWSQSTAALEVTRSKILQVKAKRQQTKVLADAAQWKTAENVLLSRSAEAQSKALAVDLYGHQLLSRSTSNLSVEETAPEIVFMEMARLCASSEAMAKLAQNEELVLRTEEMRWQTEEQARSLESDRLHEQQQSQWLKWQDALQRKNSLEDEISQMDQSAKALQVMLQELHDHRDQARALHENRAFNDKALMSLRGTLPWPAQGAVVQNYGRQYSNGLNQLVISNGIKIAPGPERAVRVIQEGKVLFASPFRRYGELVIVQHKNGLTSVYAGLGTIQVKEGAVMAALDQIGLTGASGAFYFELRRDEQPVNPLVFLSPAPTSELSTRRKFR